MSKAEAKAAADKAAQAAASAAYVSRNKNCESGF